MSFKSKEARKKMWKEAADYHQLTRLGIGAAGGAGLGAASTPNEEDRLQNALYGAIVGGAGGAVMPSYKSMAALSGMGAGMGALGGAMGAGEEDEAEGALRGAAQGAYRAPATTVGGGVLGAGTGLIGGGLLGAGTAAAAHGLTKGRSTEALRKMLVRGKPGKSNLSPAAEGTAMGAASGGTLGAIGGGLGGMAYGALGDPYRTGKYRGEQVSEKRTRERESGNSKEASLVQKLAYATGQIDAKLKLGNPL